MYDRQDRVLPDDDSAAAIMLSGGAMQDFNLTINLPAELYAKVEAYALDNRLTVRQAVIEILAGIFAEYDATRQHGKIFSHVEK